MPKNPLELEDNPRSFRCPNAVGKLIEKYSTAWERTPSWFVTWILRHHFKDELPPALRPGKLEPESEITVNWTGSEEKKKP